MPHNVSSIACTDFDDQKVKIDGNHPLVGKDLTFELELMELV